MQWGCWLNNKVLLKEQNGFRTWHVMEGRGCVTSCSVYSRIFLKFMPRYSCCNRKVMVMFGLFQNSMKMQKTLHRDLHRETLSLVMNTGQRSCNCVVSSKEAMKKKVLTACITHPILSGCLKWRLLHGGRHCWSWTRLLSNIHTHGYGVSSEAQLGVLKSQKYNRKQMVPAVKKNSDGKAGPRDFWSRPVTYCVVERRDINQEL